MGETDLVVVVPGLNVGSTLPRQLKALDSQTDLNFRVVLSDNGSSDDSRAVAESWRPRFLSLTVVDSSTRRGASSARNHAVRATTEPLILFCDADDRVHPGWVAAMREALKNAHAATGPLIPIYPDRPVGGEVWNESQLPVSMRFGPYMPSGNMGIRRDAFDALGGFDESLVLGQEDVDLGWRATSLGLDIVHAPEARVDYYQRTGLCRHLRQRFRYGRAHVQLYLKHQNEPIDVASITTSMRWFVEWGKQFPGAVREQEAGQRLGELAFQVARCLESARQRVRTPL